MFILDFLKLKNLIPMLSKIMCAKCILYTIFIFIFLIKCIFYFKHLKLQSLESEFNVNYR